MAIGEARRADRRGPSPSLSSLALHIVRKPGGIVVFLRGPCGPGDLDLLDGVLEDLVDGQGNRAVTVEAAGVRITDSGIDRVLDRLAAVTRARRAHFVVDERAYPRPDRSGDGERRES